MSKGVIIWKGFNFHLHDIGEFKGMMLRFLVKSNLTCAQPNNSKKQTFFQDPKIKKMLDNFKIPAAGEAWAMGKVAPA